MSQNALCPRFLPCPRFPSLSPFLLSLSPFSFPVPVFLPCPRFPSLSPFSFPVPVFLPPVFLLPRAAPQRPLHAARPDGSSPEDACPPSPRSAGPPPCPEPPASCSPDPGGGGPETDLTRSVPKEHYRTSVPTDQVWWGQPTGPGSPSQEDIGQLPIFVRIPFPMFTASGPSP